MTNVSDPITNEPPAAPEKRVRRRPSLRRPVTSRQPRGPAGSTSTAPVGAPSRTRRVAFAAVTLGVLLVLVVTFSATAGQFEAGPSDVLTALWHAIAGAPADQTGDAAQIDAVLRNIRFPRAVMAILVGAALAVAGAVMQGVFANPLAEPSIVGVSSGASVGAAIVIVFGLGAVSAAALPAAAFIGAAVATLTVWALSRIGGKAAVLMLVLTGIAVNAVAVAATSMLIFLGDSTSREQVIFWQLGTLSGATWSEVAVIASVFAVGFVGCVLVSRQLDVLSLGDASALASGVRIERLRVIAIVLVCLLTGIAVAFSGVIAFVGLIVPHALRLVVGPSHRYLVPLSAIGGAVVLSAADIAARTVIPFADLPIGIFTAVVGGPVFLVLLRRTLRGGGMTK